MRIVKDTEISLLQGLKKSNHESFRQLFNRYSKPLYSFSRQYLKSGELAEDVVQEVFIKIWDRRKDIDTGKSFQAYLFTIALNTIRKHFNKLAEVNKLKYDIVLDFSEQPDRLAEHENFEEMLVMLEKFINQLPEKQRQIFIRKKLEGKSQKEIADEFKITVKTVEYHITEATKFLKKEFENLRMGGLIFFILFVKN